MPSESESEPQNGGLLFRTNDDSRWGTGKGSPLVSNEVDMNFWDLLQRVVNVETNEALPKEIHSIEVDDAFNMTITLSDLVTTFGPFALPAAAFNWTNPADDGAWLPSNGYKRFDLFSTDDGLWLVLRDHISGFSFNPDAGDTGGKFYALVLPARAQYDVGFFFPGKPGTGIEVGASMFAHLAAHEFWLPQDLTGSVGGVESAPTGSDGLECLIFQNDTQVGTVLIAAGDNQATFAFANDVQFQPGDRLRVQRPDVIDDTAFELTLTFAGKKGLIVT